MRNKLIGERYRIKSRLGEGGMAMVYLALDEKLGRKVAIKILHSHLTENEDICKRFQYEARSISSIDHPNIIKVYDFSGANSQSLWIVTEIIQGQDIDKLVQNTPQKRLHPILATCVVREISKALNAAHQKGLVHRDIKPENVMITNSGKIKLMDFGIAKNMQTSNKTQTGTFMGSPSYMSPEQIRGKEVDLRSDIFSLGVVFYELLTGKLPFNGESTHDVILKVVAGKYIDLKTHNPSIPDEICDIVNGCLKIEPEERYQHISEMAKSIDTFLSQNSFVESHVELERYFQNPNLYLSKLEVIENNNSRTVKHDKTHLEFKTNVSSSTNQKTINVASYNQSSIGDGSTIDVGSDEWKRLQKIAESNAPLPYSERRDHKVPATPKRRPRKSSLSSREHQKELLRISQKNRKMRSNRKVANNYNKYNEIPRLTRNIQRKQSISIMLNILLSIIIIAIGLVAFLIFQKYTNSATPRPIKEVSTTSAASEKRAPKEMSNIQREVTPVKKNFEKRSTNKPASKRKPTSTPHRNRKPSVPTKTRKSSTESFSKPDSTTTTAPPKKEVAIINKSIQSTAEKSRNKASSAKIIEVSQISVASSPAARIFVDGKFIGTTISSTGQAKVHAISTNSKSMTLKRNGYKPYTIDLKLSPQEHKRFTTVQLERSSTSTFSLELVSSMYPYNIAITNLESSQTQSKVVNSSNEKLRLESGKYRIRAYKDGKEIIRTIQLNDHMEFNVSF